MPFRCSQPFGARCRCRRQSRWRTDSSLLRPDPWHVQPDVGGNGNVTTTNVLGQGMVGQDRVHIQLDDGLPQGLADGILFGMLGNGRIDDAIDGSGVVVVVVVVVLLMKGRGRVLLDRSGGGHHHG